MADNGKKTTQKDFLTSIPPGSIAPPENDPMADAPLIDSLPPQRQSTRGPVSKEFFEMIESSSAIDRIRQRGDKGKKTPNPVARFDIFINAVFMDVRTFFKGEIDEFGQPIPDAEMVEDKTFKIFAKIIEQLEEKDLHGHHVNDVYFHNLSERIDLIEAYYEYFYYLASVYGFDKAFEGKFTDMVNHLKYTWSERYGVGKDGPVSLRLNSEIESLKEEEKESLPPVQGPDEDKIPASEKTSRPKRNTLRFGMFAENEARKSSIPYTSMNPINLDKELEREKKDTLTGLTSLTNEETPSKPEAVRISDVPPAERDVMDIPDRIDAPLSELWSRLLSNQTQADLRIAIKKVYLNMFPFNEENAEKITFMDVRISSLEKAVNHIKGNEELDRKLQEYPVGILAPIANELFIQQARDKKVMRAISEGIWSYLIDNHFDEQLSEIDEDSEEFEALIDKAAHGFCNTLRNELPFLSGDIVWAFYYFQLDKTAESETCSKYKQQLIEGVRDTIRRSFVRAKRTVPSTHPEQLARIPEQENATVSFDPRLIRQEDGKTDDEDDDFMDDMFNKIILDGQTHSRAISSKPPSADDDALEIPRAPDVPSGVETNSDSVEPEYPPESMSPDSIQRINTAPDYPEFLKKEDYEDISSMMEDEVSRHPDGIMNMPPHWTVFKDPDLGVLVYQYANYWRIWRDENGIKYEQMQGEKRSFYLTEEEEEAGGPFEKRSNTLPSPTTETSADDLQDADVGEDDTTQVNQPSQELIRQSTRPQAPADQTPLNLEEELAQAVREANAKADREAEKAETEQENEENVYAEVIPFPSGENVSQNDTEGDDEPLSAPDANVVVSLKTRNVDQSDPDHPHVITQVMETVVVGDEKKEEISSSDESVEKPAEKTLVMEAPIANKEAEETDLPDVAEVKEAKPEEQEVVKFETIPPARESFSSIIDDDADRTSRPSLTPSLGDLTGGPESSIPAPPSVPKSVDWSVDEQAKLDKVSKLQEEEIERQKVLAERRRYLDRVYKITAAGFAAVAMTTVAVYANYEIGKYNQERQFTEEIREKNKRSSEVTANANEVFAEINDTFDAMRTLQAKEDIIRADAEAFIKNSKRLQYRIRSLKEQITSLQVLASNDTEAKWAEANAKDLMDQANEAELALKANLEKADTEWRRAVAIEKVEELKEAKGNAIKVAAVEYPRIDDVVNKQFDSKGQAIGEQIVTRFADATFPVSADDPKLEAKLEKRKGYYTVAVQEVDKAYESYLGSEFKTDEETSEKKWVEKNEPVVAAKAKVDENFDENGEPVNVEAAADKKFGENLAVTLGGEDTNIHTSSTFESVPLKTDPRVNALTMKLGEFVFAEEVNEAVAKVDSKYDEILEEGPDIKVQDLAPSTDESREEYGKINNKVPGARKAATPRSAYAKLEMDWDEFDRKEKADKVKAAQTAQAKELEKIDLDWDEFLTEEEKLAEWAKTIASDRKGSLKAKGEVCIPPLRDDVPGGCRTALLNGFIKECKTAWQQEKIEELFAGLRLNEVEINPLENGTVIGKLTNAEKLAEANRIINMTEAQVEEAELDEGWDMIDSVNRQVNDNVFINKLTA
ncbi:hypothetical protein GF340_03235 [Candidatus Peregrinibacteria bacterium]|nr:hypothetical protein [Candidatus Peregrinibacteria bacterium]